MSYSPNSLKGRYKALSGSKDATFILFGVWESFCLCEKDHLFFLG